MKLPRVKKDAGYYMRVWRATYNLSQQDAAELFGVTASHWSLIEGGGRFASPELAKELAVATGGAFELFLNMGDK